MFRRISILGGPSAGKSTVASYVFFNLKEKDYNVEFVSEFVKQWTFINRKPQSFDQVYLFAQQMHAEDEILNSGIDYIVTECPIYLAYFYATVMRMPGSSNLLELLIKFEEKYPSINVFLPFNNKTYKQIARFHDEKEAMCISQNMEKSLSWSSPPFRLFQHTTFNCHEKESILEYIEKQMKGTNVE